MTVTSHEPYASTKTFFVIDLEGISPDPTSLPSAVPNKNSDLIFKDLRFVDTNGKVISKCLGTDSQVTITTTIENNSIYGNFLYQVVIVDGRVETIQKSLYNFW